MTIVALPGRLDAASAPDVIACAAQIQSSPDVVLDASRLAFAEPFGVVTIAAALLRREAAGLARATYVPPQHDQARKFLDEIGFADLVGASAPGRRGTLPIQRISVASLDPSYAHNVAALIEHEVPNTSESVAYLVETAIKEMLQNVVEHAGSATDAVVLTRWYRRDENVRIAIADSGIGFAASLARNPANAAIRDEQLLIRHAVTIEGTTGRTAQRFGGLGLKRLLQVCSSRGGTVHVTTHTVDAHYGSGNDREIIVPRLDGTTVEIDFRPGPDDGSRSENEPEEFF
jgi:hypothetical protein